MLIPCQGQGWEDSLACPQGGFFSSCKLVFSQHRQRGGEDPAGEENILQGRRTSYRGGTAEPGSGFSCCQQPWNEGKTWKTPAQSVDNTQVWAQGWDSFLLLTWRNPQCQTGAVCVLLSSLRKVFLLCHKGAQSFTASLLASTQCGANLVKSVEGLGFHPLILRAVLLVNTSVFRSQGRKSSGC